ncbi:protein lev-9-like, partial [Limulus polyphemus]|uniref:Protein lev-9-like n=1 Tax=Limulus polyphemus TaxID=6850 RepID=A0ABM1RV63_LIMPO
LKCDYLEDIENGLIRRPEIEGFGAKVTYSCNEGFVMSGPRERRCQGDGSWSDKAPACRKKALCGPAPFVRHANHTSKTRVEFDIGFLLKYYCFTGYEAQGFSEAKCMFYNGTAQWFGPDLVCKPRSCGHPGLVEHADLEGDIFTYTRQVTFRCRPGYELFGRANIHCRENGMWSSALPTCRPVICPQPQDPQNGRAHYTAVTFQSVVKFQCRHGYRLDGNETLKCGANRTWEGEIPICKEIDCPRLGVLHNGYLEGSTSTLGSVIYFRCFDGMKFEGGSRSTTCLKTGNWSHPLPKCLGFAARCKHLPEQPKHGMVIAPKTDHNMTALYRCKDGYKLVGPNLTTCNFGKWTSDTPRCEEVYCPFPGYLPNGRVLLVGHMGMYDYRPYVRKVTNNRQIMYECNRGYMLMDGPPGATCVDGKWSPTYLPRCVKGSHPRIRWTRSIRERFLRRVKRRKAGERNRNVGRKKRRRPKDPCTPIPQTPVMEVDILRLGTGNSSMPHGTKLRVRCTKGYGLNLKKNRIRCARGRWKPGEPKCITLPCAIPKTEHGHYHYFQKVVKFGESVDHGEVVRLNCFPGFQLVGVESLRCWYGEWTTGSLPKCVAGPCELPTIPHGYYLSGYRAGLTISHGSSVSYDCKPDYVKADINPTHCKEGRLLPNPPACLTHTLRVKVPTW